MEKVLTVEVNLNLKADESLQQIVAYIFGQKLTADNERNSQPTTEQPNPEPQPAIEPQPAETEAKPKRTRSKKADPEPQPAANPEPQPAANPELQPATDPEPQPATEVSLEEVKQAFFQKLAGHRDEIRSKINELGAPSLSTIEAAKLPEMLNFLKGLD